MLEKYNGMFDKNENIFELLPPMNVYNDSIEKYLNNNIIDAYNYYPKIYKSIGNYLYNNLFEDNNENQERNITIQEVYQICNEIFNNLLKNNCYNNQQETLLKDIILIVILVELERNGYIIQE